MLKSTSGSAVPLTENSITRQFRTRLVNINYSTFGLGRCKWQSCSPLDFQLMQCWRDWRSSWPELWQAFPHMLRAPSRGKRSDRQHTEGCEKAHPCYHLSHCVKENVEITNVRGDADEEREGNAKERRSADSQQVNCRALELEHCNHLPIQSRTKIAVVSGGTGWIEELSICGGTSTIRHLQRKQCPGKARVAGRQ
jgi:hypothetical protein